jgi:hypothetical protein
MGLRPGRRNVLQQQAQIVDVQRLVENMRGAQPERRPGGCFRPWLL